MREALILLIALALPGVTLAAESPQQAFAKLWEGRTVTVRSTLYSLIYSERGKLGTTRSGLREGLVVATPYQGSFLKFDGRQGRVDVIQHDAKRFVAAVNETYHPDALDVRSYRKLEAFALDRYDPGVELVVSAVRVDRDEVRFEFARGADTEPVTGIRIKWPVPLSKTFSERDLVENLIGQFVEINRS